MMLIPMKEGSRGPDMWMNLKAFPCLDVYKRQVLITTKRGKIGAPQVKMSAYVGFSKLGKKIDALNTEQYKDLSLIHI